MINGLINIYKEPGFTSHDVVSKLRGIVKQKKIGHTGTLDPDAEGVLPVCLGKATKLCDMLAGETKTYEAVLLLGVTTDTQDAGGIIRESRPVSCTEEEVRRCAEAFLGEQLQVPPMYSALKQNGKKLYELAREGKEVERAARPVHFYEITVMKTELPRAWLRVTCSKGTYIRTLCHDIGEALGCGGCMEHLTRTRVGRFEWKDAFRLSGAASVRPGQTWRMYPAAGQGVQFASGAAGGTGRGSGCPERRLSVSGTGQELRRAGGLAGWQGIPCL